MAWVLRQTIRWWAMPRWAGRSLCVAASFVVTVTFGIVRAAQADDPLCAFAPGDGDDIHLCANYPFDLTSFSSSLEYMVVNKAVQTPFDMFAWRAFTALNWRDVAPLEPAPDAWQSMPRKDAVVGQDMAAACRRTDGEAGPLVLSDLVQADGAAAIDQNGNPLIYETRLNGTAAAYVAGLASEDANFPQGQSTEAPPSVHVKTAWMWLEYDDPGFITERGVVRVPAEQSLSGQPLCLEGLFGLVGMHIVTKVGSGNGDEWLWATFEHQDTAPLSPVARRINSIYSKDLFPNGCPAPQAASSYLLFDPSCPSCATNAPPPRPLWSQTPPFARASDGSPLAPSRITRCWQIFEPTQDTNARWQARLADTPLAQYRLITNQWRGANKSPLFEHGEVPRFVSNVTMESYLQEASEGSCLGCHAEARTRSGGFADFAFYLSELGR